MQDWRSRLTKLVRVTGEGDGPPEPLAYFRAEPPSGDAWPGGMPASPALREFYSICGGARIGWFELHPLAEIKDLHEWASGDCSARPGRYWVLGDTEPGLPLVWDGARDRVGYYDSEIDRFLVLSRQRPGMGPSIKEFIAYLLAHPRERGDQRVDEWSEALDMLDQMA